MKGFMNALSEFITNVQMSSGVDSWHTYSTEYNGCTITYCMAVTLYEHLKFQEDLIEAKTEQIEHLENYNKQLLNDLRRKDID